MNILFTKHAKDMLELRGIKEDLILKCLKNPDKITPSKFGKKIYLKDMGKNYLKLIVSEEENKLVVITLYWLAKSRKTSVES